MALGRMSNEDQFKFLLSCVKWSERGKVDFTEVASECSIVTKGAAAKRYERMLKTYGENTAPPKEKAVTMSKPGKRKKPGSMLENTKYDEDNDQKPRMIKRPRNDYQHDLKQEPPPVAYPPYMYHPILPPGSFQPRHMPPFMHQGMTHNLPHHMQHVPQTTQTPFPNMPGIHNNQFILPFHPMQPFAIQQNLPPPPPVQEANALGPFDNLYNQNFGDGGFEALLHGDMADTQDPNDAMQAEIFPAPRQSLHTPMAPQAQVFAAVKAEQCQSLRPPLQEGRSPSEPIRFSLSLHEATGEVPSMPTTVVPEELATPVLSKESVRETPEQDTGLLFKQENDTSCIFISD